MVVYLTIKTQFGITELNNQPFFGLVGFHEAIALFEKAIDDKKYASISVKGA